MQSIIRIHLGWKRASFLSKSLRARKALAGRYYWNNHQGVQKAAIHLKNTGYQMKVYFQVLQTWNFLSCKFKRKHMSRSLIITWGVIREQKSSRDSTIACLVEKYNLFFFFFFWQVKYQNKSTSGTFTSVFISILTGLLLAQMITGSKLHTESVLPTSKE